MNVRARMQLSHLRWLAMPLAPIVFVCWQVFYPLPVPSVLSRHLLGDSTQVSNSPPPPTTSPLPYSKYHLLRLSGCAFSLIYYKTSDSITKCTIIDSRLNGIRIFHFLWPTINNNIVSGEAILSAENSGKLWVVDRGFAVNPAGGTHSAPQNP